MTSPTSSAYSVAAVISAKSGTPSAPSVAAV